MLPPALKHLNTTFHLPAYHCQVLLLNQRIQSQNRAPNDFPQFIREGFDVKVIAPGFKTSPDGIIYKDYTEGTGEMPQDGQVSGGGVCL